jgi:hypothetical protein
MSDPSGVAPEALVLRLSVPSEGDLRIIASDVAAKVAEYLGEAPERIAAAGEAAASLASRVAPRAGEAEITFEFRTGADGLLIGARCGDRSATTDHSVSSY